MSGRRVRTGLAWAALSALLVVRLSAHAEMVRAEPASGAVVPTAPARISVTFSEAVDATPDSLTLLDPNGGRVAIGPTSNRRGDPATIEADLRSLSAGTHTVRWRVVSEDGHPIDGTFQFSVNVASAAAVLQDQGATAGAGGLGAVAGRALHLLGLGWILGPMALIAITLPLALRMHRRLWRQIFFGALTVIGAGVVMFVAQSSAVNGSFAAGIQGAAVTSLVSSRWGRVWSYRMLADLVLIALALGAASRGAAENSQRSRALFGVSAVVAGVLVVFTAMNGHSAATQPVWLSLSVDWLHLAATAVWIGGLGVLALAVLPAIQRMPRDQRDVALPPLMRRFSTLALVCVELLLFTGLYHTWAHVDAPSSLTSTQYGQALLVKLGLVAAMMLPAAVNLFVLKPRLATTRPFSGDAVLGLFRRSLSIEFAIGVLVMVVVGRLTSVPPARVEAAAVKAPAKAAEPSVTLVDAAGGSIVQLTVSPLRPGANNLDVQLPGLPELTVPREPARLRIVPPPHAGMSPWTVVPDVDSNHLHAVAALGSEGTWKIEVMLSAGSTATFSIDLPARGAHELLVAATERMNRFTSVREDVNTLEHGRRTESLVDHRASAPDGSLQPAFGAHLSIDDPVLVGRETIGGEECFVVAYTTADEGRHRAWISTNGLLLMQHTAATPDRLVVSRFTPGTLGASHAAHGGHAAHAPERDESEHWGYSGGSAVPPSDSSARGRGRCPGSDFARGLRGDVRVARRVSRDVCGRGRATLVPFQSHVTVQSLVPRGECASG